MDGEQTQTLAQMVRYARENLAGLPVPEVVARLMALVEEKGLGAVCGEKAVPAGLAMPRVQEIFACFNRY